jgi:hypothetical protein
VVNLYGELVSVIQFIWSRLKQAVGGGMHIRVVDAGGKRIEASSRYGRVRENDRIVVGEWSSARSDVSEFCIRCGGKTASATGAVERVPAKFAAGSPPLKLPVVSWSLVGSGTGSEEIPCLMRRPSYEAKKKVLSFLIGPPNTPPN